MGDLTNAREVPLKRDNQNKNGLVGYHYRWRDEGRRVGEAEEDRGRYTRPTNTDIEKMEGLVRKALAKTSNKSVLGLDGIEYSLIKPVLNLILGSTLIRELAENLIKGKIPKEW